MNDTEKNFPPAFVQLCSTAEQMHFPFETYYDDENNPVLSMNPIVPFHITLLEEQSLFVLYAVFPNPAAKKNIDRLSAFLTRANGAILVGCFFADEKGRIAYRCGMDFISRLASGDAIKAMISGAYDACLEFGGIIEAICDGEGFINSQGVWSENIDDEDRIMETAQAMHDVLSERHIAFCYDKTRLTGQGKTSILGHDFKLSLSIDPTECVITIIFNLPVSFTKEDETIAAMAVCSLNDNILVGNFEVHDLNIDYRVTSFFSGTALSKSALDDMVSMCLAACDVYYTPLYRLSAGEISIERFTATLL